MHLSSHQTLHWGLTQYADALAQQEELVRLRIQKKIPNTLILTEHHPIYTLGRRPESEKNILKTNHIPVFYTNRGGDITYHGPGQIVGYAIIDLNQSRDLHAYLRLLEEVIIDSLSHIGLRSERRPGKTGIWINNKKIAAIGIAVKQWVTYHGFALNIDNDLTPFQDIIPCGIPQEEGSVTSIKQECPHASYTLHELEKIIASAFWKVF